MVCNRTGCASSSCPTIRRFVDKLRDVVGLYVDPPAHAIVLSVDEKSQIQALDRTQPDNVIEKQVPAGKTIHAIVDNYAAHKHPNVRRWLERHPRWTLHFTPTSASWLNAVEGFFATLTKRRLKRGVFRSVVGLQAAINRFLEHHNQQSPTLHLDRRPRQNHRRGQARAPSVRFHPLVARVGSPAKGANVYADQRSPREAVWFGGAEGQRFLSENFSAA
jgi:transposase